MATKSKYSRPVETDSGGSEALDNPSLLFTTLSTDMEERLERPHMLPLMV